MRASSLVRFGTVAGGAALLLAVGISACQEEANCGPGTVEENGACVPLQLINCTGPGVHFENGRCVLDESACGPNTELSEDGTQCVGTGGGPDDVGQDTGGDVADTGADIGGDTAGDGPVDTVEEVVEFVPECGDDLGGNQVCMWGQALNFVDGSPLPADADPLLQVQVKDLIDALPRTNRGLGLIADVDLVEGGYWIAPSFDLTHTPPRTLILTVGEHEDGEPTDPLEGTGTVWQRSIAGLLTTSTGTTEYGDLTIYGVARADIAVWNAALALDEPIEEDGAMVVRIVEFTEDEQLVPIEGAAFEYLSGACICSGEQTDCDGTNCAGRIEYFADEELTTFKAHTDATTGPSGVALIYGTGSTDNCNAAADGFSSAGAILCGVSRNRISIGLIRMLAD